MDSVGFDAKPMREGLGRQLDPGAPSGENNRFVVLVGGLGVAIPTAAGNSCEAVISEGFGVGVGSVGPRGSPLSRATGPDELGT